MREGLKKNKLQREGREEFVLVRRSFVVVVHGSDLISQ